MTATPPPYPTIRRLACTTYRTRVTVALDGTATCARGHLWLDQKDAYGRTAEEREQLRRQG